MEIMSEPDVTDREKFLGNNPSCQWPRQPRVGVRKGHAWYLLQARSNAEKAITDFLGRFGYKVYYPKSLVLKPVPKRQLTPAQRANGAVVRRPHLMPVFPGYPFIRFDISDPLVHDLFNIAGVYGLHCTEEWPVVVDDVWIQHLQSFEQDGVIPASTALRDLFSVGEKVRINGAGGALRGFNAVVQELPHKLKQQIESGVLSELDESMCVELGVWMFGRVSTVHMPIGAIEKF